MDGRLLSTTKAHLAGVNVLAANDISGTMVTGSQDKKVKMWTSDGIELDMKITIKPI